MSRVFLDGSAILVLVDDEPGSAAVAETLDEAVVSADADWAEFPAGVEVRLVR